MNYKRKKVSISAILELATKKGLISENKDFSNFINADVASLLLNKFMFNENNKKKTIKRSRSSLHRKR